MSDNPANNPANKLPEWIKRSGWIRENGDTSDGNEPVNPINPEPVNDNTIEEGSNSADLVFPKSDAGQSTPVDGGPDQSTFDSQNPDDLPLEEPDISTDNGIGSVDVDLSPEDTHETSSIESVPTSVEPFVQTPEMDENNGEVVQKENFLADLPSIPEDEENAGEFAELPDWLKNYEPDTQRTEESMVSSKDEFIVPVSGESLSNSEEVIENSTLANETPDILQSSPPETLTTDESETAKSSFETDLPLPPGEPSTAESSVDSTAYAPMEEDLSVIVPPPLPSSFVDTSSIDNEQLQPNVEIKSIPFSPEEIFKEETVTVEEIEEPPVDTIKIEVDEFVQAPEFPAGMTEPPEPTDSILAPFSEEDLGASSSLLDYIVQPDTEEIELSTTITNQEVDLDSIYVEDEPTLNGPLESNISEILSQVKYQDYSNIDTLLEEYHSHSTSSEPLLMRLEEVSDEQKDSPEFWQLIGDLLSKSGNHEEALDAYRLSEKIIRK